MVSYILILATLFASSILAASSSPHSPRSDTRPDWQCDPGQQYDTASTACKACLIGTFSPAGVQCYASPLGFFNDLTSATDPKGCLPGTYSDVTGLTACKSCPALQFSYTAATSCSLCPDGSTASANGQSCVDCLPGSSSTGGAACVACSPGSFSPAGNQCHRTPSGFYNDKAGASDPINCSGGFYSDAESSLVCKKCKAPLMSFAAATRCVPCASGRSTDGQNCISSAVTCSPGSAPSAGSCKKCLPGSFSPAGNQCHPTPAGFFNNKLGQINPIGCEGGSYSDVESSIVCKRCMSPLMSFAAATKCIACPDGSSSRNGKICVSCLPGSTSIGGATCLACKPGFFSPDARNCYNTPAGYFNNAFGQSNPIGCAPGSFTAVESSIVCIKCKAPLTSFAAATSCSDNANTCPPSNCGKGLYSKIGSTVCMTIPQYNIAVRDSLDTKTLGYVSRDYQFAFGIFVIVPIVDLGMIIAPPSVLCSNLPQNLVGTTQAGSAGNNLVLAASSDTTTFDADHPSYVFLSQGPQDDSPDAFTQTADWGDDGAQSDVWILSSNDNSGLVPLSLSFLDSNSKVVTCATFFQYLGDNTIGASCSKDLSSEFGKNEINPVLLYLVPAQR